MANGAFSRRELKHLLKRYQEKLKAMNIPVTNIYLYGSYAKNKARKGSDIDICIISPKFKDRIDATMMLMKIRNDDELMISPVAFSPDTFVEENPLAWEIKQTGSLL